MSTGLCAPRVYPVRSSVIRRVLALGLLGKKKKECICSVGSTCLVFGKGRQGVQLVSWDPCREAPRVREVPECKKGSQDKELGRCDEQMRRR